MNNQIYNNNLKIIASGDVPVVTRAINPTPSTESAEVYDDYGVMSYYPPLNFSFLIIIIGIILVIGQFIFLAGVLIAAFTVKKTIKCPKCGKTNNFVKNKPPEKCLYCNFIFPKDF